jgi:type VI secretion system secreted protein VgrG
MKYQNKYVFVCLLAIATFLSVASFQPALAQSAPSLGAASGFSVLGGQAVTCTNSVITGDVGVSPTPAFTNTSCTIAGNTPPATDVAAALARTAFLSTYNALGLMPCGQTFSTAAFTGNVRALGPLAPGVYCFPAAVTFTDTTLTLDGSTNPNGIRIFKVGAALTGSGFHVVMANGAQACNVFWSVGAAVTLSTSTLLPLFQGNLLAGNAAGGSVTITGGSLIGRVLANVAITMTGTNIHGSCALLARERQAALRIMM